MVLYYKIISNNYKSYYGNYKYKEGLNVLDEPFKSNPACEGGGLYFCDLEYVGNYLMYGYSILCILTIPSDATVVKLKEKYKADKITVVRFMDLAKVSTWERELKDANNKDKGLQWAAEEGHLDIVKYLVLTGANVRADNDRALRVAFNEGHLEIIKYLVLNGADVHPEHYLPQMSDKLDVMKYFISTAGTRFTADYRNIFLYWASYFNHTEAVEYLSNLIIE
jgi:hypothetical protein